MPRTKALPKAEHLDGLAKRLGDDTDCRHRILETGTLLRWPCPKRTGVIGSTSLRLNVDLMIAVGSIVCPQSSSQLGLVVGPIKDEACFGA